MTDKDIYKCNLLSITPNIMINPKLSKEQNIHNANTKVVATVLVKRVMKDKYFKEIITGKLIPVSTILRTKNDNLAISGDISYVLTNSPVFIRLKKYCYYTEETTDLEVASILDVASYEKKHPYPKEYLDELNELFYQGEENYRIGLNQNTNDNEPSVKSLFKRLIKK